MRRICDCRICRIFCPRPYWERKGVKRLKNKKKTAKRAKIGETRAFIEMALKERPKCCVIWPYPAKNGRPQIKLDGKTVDVVAYVCERAHGPAPSPVSRQQLNAIRRFVSVLTTSAGRLASSRSR